MAAGRARRTFAPGGASGASQNPDNRPEADLPGYTLIVSVTCTAT